MKVTILSFMTCKIIVLSHRMQQENISKHYGDVAGHYDDLYGFTNDYIAEFAVKHLQLKPDDVLVDIGAGTGKISSLIWKKAGQNQWQTIEPVIQA